MSPDFADYVRARQHVLLRAAYLMCGDRQRAEDVVQEALLKAALRWPRLRDQSPDAFVRTVMYRDLVSTWRRTRREHLQGDAVLERAVQQPTSEERLDVLRALATLQPRQRACVVLRYVEDRTERETAEILGVAIGTVKSQTHDGLRTLRQALPGYALTTGEPR